MPPYVYVTTVKTKRFIYKIKIILIDRQTPTLYIVKVKNVTLVYYIKRIVNKGQLWAQSRNIETILNTKRTFARFTTSGIVPV